MATPITFTMLFSACASPGDFRTFGSGAATAYEAAGLLTWPRRERKLAALDIFNQMLAVLETAAHLDVLVLQGRLRALVSDGTTGYVPR